MFAHAADKGANLGHGNTGLLRFVTGVDLNMKPRCAALPVHLLAKAGRQLLPIKRFDHVKQGHGLSRLVGLKRTDQAQFKIRKIGPPRRPMGLCFLDPIFTEDTLPGGQSGLKPFFGLAF